MTWPPDDWGTLLERGGLDRFRDGLRDAANVDVAVDDFGRSMLMYAARERWPELVEMLLGAGADPNHRNARQRTTLHYADPRWPAIWRALLAAGGMVRFLLERGARADARDREGKTALAHATEFQPRREIEPLIVNPRPSAAHRKGQTDEETP